MFHFTSFRSLRTMNSSAGFHVTMEGLPHSEIRVSSPVCGCPRLIAACHVLLRLLVPRHPPSALCSLIAILSICSFNSLSDVIFSMPCVTYSCQRTGNLPPLARRQPPKFIQFHPSAFAFFLPSSCSQPRVGRPDWVRTSDPALIKRML